MDADKPEESGNGIAKTAKAGAVTGAALYGIGGAIGGAGASMFNPVTAGAAIVAGVVGGLLLHGLLAGVLVAAAAVATVGVAGALIGGGIGIAGGAIGGGVVGGLLGGLVKGVKKGVEWTMGLVTGENGKSATPAQDMQQQAAAYRAASQDAQAYLQATQAQADAQRLAQQARADAVASVANPNASTDNAPKVAASAAAGQAQTARLG